MATAASFANFNSRSRVGSDAVRVVIGKDDHRVSIRAPAWGATRTGLNFSSSCCLFQFALPHGSDVDDYKTNRSKAQFQFALPHGERRRGLGCGGLEIEFQFALPCEVKPTAGSSFGAGAGYTFT